MTGVLVTMVEKQADTGDNRRPVRGWPSCVPATSCRDGWLLRLASASHINDTHHQVYLVTPTTSRKNLH